ncbi:dnaJ homolog subfamily C member 12 isoform X2 [Agelaius tricolor]|uniref:dnaJ homolog subfamily C member 12 isoform X2 n=1 Tax=Agelaius tricolor TaxID=9191 RepID=UPI0039F1D216
MPQARPGPVGHRCSCQCSPECSVQSRLNRAKEKEKTPQSRELCLSKLKLTKSKGELCSTVCSSTDNTVQEQECEGVSAVSENKLLFLLCPLHSLQQVLKSMHWAVQSKKDQMLEAPDDFGNTNNITNEMWAQQTESSGEGLLEGSREQEDVAIPDVQPQSSKNPDSPRFSEGNYWHLRFRWSGDAPSDLLRKFRNYEI